MAAHKNKEKPPSRRHYTDKASIEKLFSGKTRTGATVRIGERRTNRMNRRLQTLEY